MNSQVIQCIRNLLPNEYTNALHPHSPIETVRSVFHPDWGSQTFRWYDDESDVAQINQ